jgi:hypothetical protein
MQGECLTRGSCTDSHVDINPEAPICSHFRAGFCPRDSTCPDKHFTEATTQRFESDPSAYEAVLQAARQRALTQASRHAGVRDTAQKRAHRSAVPALLGSLPDPEFPGSDPVLFHIGGLLVFPEDDEL